MTMTTIMSTLPLLIIEGVIIEEVIIEEVIIEEAIIEEARRRMMISGARCCAILPLLFTGCWTILSARRWRWDCIVVEGRGVVGVMMNG